MADSLASQIITAIGGPENVRSLTHCATRLRFELADASKVDQNALEHMKGVLGAVPQSGDRFQVVIGGGVATVYENIMHLPEMANAGAASASGEGQKSNADVKAEARSKARGKVAWLDSFFEYLADSFRPILGVLLGASIIIALVNLLISLNVIPNDEASAGWVFVKAIWKGVFYFLPIMVGYNAAKEFGGTPILGGILGALLAHPGLASVDLADGPRVPGRGGVISVLLVAALAAFVEKRLRRIIPEMVSLFLPPLFTFLIAGTIAICVLQPLGGFLSDCIGTAATSAIGSGGAITGFILGGTFLPMVMLGIHQTLTPIHAELLARYGVTILLPVLAMAGAGQVGASFAVYCKTKNRFLKKTIASALPVGIMGVGEPLIYGVTLPLGKPFIGACIGGACGGAVQAQFMVGAATLGISGLPLAAATDQIPVYLLGLVTAYIGGFIATWLIGFDDPPEES